MDSETVGSTVVAIYYIIGWAVVCGLTDRYFDRLAAKYPTAKPRKFGLDAFVAVSVGAIAWPLLLIYDLATWDEPL